MNEHNQSIFKSDITDRLLAWYDHHARVLPWRIPPGDSKAGIVPDPYHVWLSEVMLQQTQIATVRNYYLEFLRLWPTVEDLAAAEADDVMKAWAGLGYYSRARNLKKCAELIVRDHGGRFPPTREELIKLPGIGDYTSAAIAAIAFGETATVVDGNIERVIARLERITAPMPSAKKTIRHKAGKLVPPDRPGDFAQAMMDLGATLCTPRAPACDLCPVSATCSAYAHGDMERFPVKARKAQKPTRKGAAFIIRNSRGGIWLRKRATDGLLGGMSEVPGTHWTSRRDGETGEGALPFSAEWRKAGIARHTFTHFHLELEVWETCNGTPTGEGWWSAPQDLAGEALPTVMRKAIAVALPDAFGSNPG